MTGAAATPLPGVRGDAAARRRKADYERRRYQQKQAGSWAPFTSTGPVRDHLEQPDPEIAQRLGVSDRTVLPPTSERPAGPPMTGAPFGTRGLDDRSLGRRLAYISAGTKRRRNDADAQASTEPRRQPDA